MARKYIDVRDFDLFLDVVRAASRIVESAKFQIGQGGLEIYGARSKIARCELTSNAVSSAEPVEFSVENLQLFLKLLQSAKEIHAGDYSGLKMSFDSPFVRIESKKFKTKLAACNENLISQWVSKKIETEMVPVFEFTGGNDMIKRVNSHSFMFSNPKDVRVYLETKEDMESNAVFATLGNKETELNNEITLKFGLVTSGSLLGNDGEPDRKIILDLERMNLFNAAQSEQIAFQLMNLNCLVGRVKAAGKDGAFMNLNIYSTVLKS